MKYQKRLTLIVAGMLIAGTVSVFSGCSANGEQIAGEVVDVSKSQDIKINDKTIKIDDKALRADVKFPQIDGLKDQKVQDIINKRFQKGADEFVDMYAQQAKIFKQTEGEDNNVQVISADYEVKYNDGNILSIAVVQNVGEGESLYSMDDTFNIDIETGKEIELRQFFKNGDYKEKIESYIRKNLDGNGQKYSVTVGDDQNYYMDADNIVVCFQPYQIGSDQDKNFEFKVPFELFKDQINTDLKLKPYAVSVDSKKVEVSQEWVYGDANIPVISGLMDSQVQSNINSMLEKEIMDYMNKFEQSAKIDYEDMKQYPEFNGNPYFTSVTFEEKCNQKGILSLYIVYYEYTGGAHGMHTDIAYNIDLETGECITLDGLFNKDYNYKSVIDKSIYKQMDQINQKYVNEALTRGENPEDAYVPYQGFEGIADNQSFYVKDGVLGIYFGLYEIAPYAAGVPVFEIPLSELSDGMDPKHAEILN